MLPSVLLQDLDPIRTISPAKIAAPVNNAPCEINFLLFMARTRSYGIYLMLIFFESFENTGSFSVPGSFTSSEIKLATFTSSSTMAVL